MSVRAPVQPVAVVEGDTLEVGRFKRARRAYGFDEVALVPGRITINPQEVDSSFELGSLRLAVPILAAAMDGVVDVRFAIEIGRLGGMAVINLDGLQTRYVDPTGVLREIAEAPRDRINQLLQKVYQAPIREHLIGERIAAVKRARVPVAVSTVPAQTSRRSGLVQEAGADCLVVQGTVLTARHISRSYDQLSFEKLCAGLSIPVIAGNCVEYEAALELMQTGIDGILVGVGPGAACTTRGVLGVGVITGGWRRPIPTCRAAPASKSASAGLSARSCSARLGWTTAPRISSAPCAPQWVSVGRVRCKSSR